MVSKSKRECEATGRAGVSLARTLHWQNVNIKIKYLSTIPSVFVNLQRAMVRGGLWRKGGGQGCRPNWIGMSTWSVQVLLWWIIATSFIMLPVMEFHQIKCWYTLLVMFATLRHCIELKMHTTQLYLIGLTWNLSCRIVLGQLELRILRTSKINNIEFTN